MKLLVIDFLKRWKWRLGFLVFWYVVGSLSEFYDMEAGRISFGLLLAGVLMAAFLGHMEATSGFLRVAVMLPVSTRKLATVLWCERCLVVSALTFGTLGLTLAGCRLVTGIYPVSFADIALITFVNLALCGALCMALLILRDAVFLVPGWRHTVCGGPIAEMLCTIGSVGTFFIFVRRGIPTWPSITHTDAIAMLTGLAMLAFSYLRREHRLTQFSISVYPEADSLADLAEPRSKLPEDRALSFQSQRWASIAPNVLVAAGMALVCVLNWVIDNVCLLRGMYSDLLVPELLLKDGPPLFIILGAFIGYLAREIMPTRPFRSLPLSGRGLILRFVVFLASFHIGCAVGMFPYYFAAKSSCPVVLSGLCLSLGLSSVMWAILMLVRRPDMRVVVLLVISFPLLLGWPIIGLLFMALTLTPVPSLAPTLTPLISVVVGVILLAVGSWGLNQAVTRCSRPYRAMEQTVKARV